LVVSQKGLVKRFWNAKKPWSVHAILTSKNMKGLPFMPFQGSERLSGGKSV
jgi:hypothetical protein